MSTILLIILVLLVLGALPTWPYSTGWGYYPSGGLGLVLVILLDSGTDGASLVGSSTGSLATPWKALLLGTSCMVCGITAGHTGQIAPTMRIRLHGRRELR